jgi:hypothetical protein
MSGRCRIEECFFSCTQYKHKDHELYKTMLATALWRTQKKKRENTHHSTREER